MDDNDSKGSNSTIDEALYEMKQETLDNQETTKTKSHFESIKSSYSDVSTISSSNAIDIKTETIEKSTNKEAIQSNSNRTNSFSSDAKANAVDEIKSKAIVEPTAKSNDEPINATTLNTNTKIVNEIKSPKMAEPRNKRTTSNKSTPKTSIPQPNVLIFYCSHCQDDLVTRESFVSVHEIHNHWLSMHSKSFQPFRFYAGLQCVCYLCKKTGSFKEIFNHFIVCHPARRIGITKCLNENKCAICDFIGDNIADHFQLKHPITTSAAIFNPIRFSKDFLNELNAIDVHKKFKCRCCDDQFNTENQIIDHYTKSVNHNLQTNPYEDLIEKLPPSYECGLCKLTMEEEEFQNHLKNHEINCLNCSMFKGTISELKTHYRLEHSNASIDKIKTNFLKGFFATKIYQSNGLVLNKSNLLLPKDDESKMLCTFFETFRPDKPDSDEPDSKKTRSKHNAKASDNKTKSMSIEKLPKIQRKRNIDSEREGALSTISGHHNRVDLPDRVKQEHLAKQKELLNNLYITGLPENDGTEKVLMDMFKRLCKHLNVPIQDDDVISIQKTWFKGNDITVKLKEQSKHESILMIANRMCILQSDDFLRLRPGRRPQNVCVMPLMTNHYERLEKKAKEHIRHGLLFSSRISDRGLAVKVSEKSMEEYVNSNRELDSYVFDNNKPISAPNTPKRGRFC